MAINIPILTEFDSKGLQSAQGAFNTFKTKVGEAEGAMGKFKAGSGVALDAVQANAGTFALAAGGAIAGFALKAIGDFQDLALAVDNFSDRTQFSLDQSSRWSEFTGDLGIEADAMIKIFDKLGKGASDQIPAFEELGVEIAFGPDGATDIEETFLRVVDKLNALKDPADRAKLSAELLGKGWQDAAEIINMKSDDIRRSLDAVAGEKLIDEEDIENAKNLREAQDELNDAIEDFTLKVGSKLIPAFAKIIDVATPVLGFFADFNSKIDFWDITAVGIIENAAGKMSDWFGDPGLQDMVDRMKALEDATYDNVDPTSDLALAWKNGYRAMADAAGAADGLEESLIDVDEALAELKGEVDKRQEWNNLIDSIEKAGEAALTAFAEKTPESLRRSQDALDDARLDVAEYIAKIDSIPEDQRTQFIAALDQANIDQVKKILDDAAYARTVAYLPTVSGAPVMPGDTPSESTGRRPAAPAPIRIPIGTVGGAGKWSAITVNVGGSVISENDLVETVRKGLVNAQRNGSGLVYTNK